jgi:hypothetical protein
MRRVAADPSLLDRARARVAEWRRERSVAELYVEAWEAVLALPLPELTSRVLDSTQEAIDRRQVSPFAGILPPRERWEILRQARSPEHRASS